MPRVRVFFSDSGASADVSGKQREVPSSRDRVETSLSAEWTVVQILWLDEWETVMDRYIYGENDYGREVKRIESIMGSGVSPFPPEEPTTRLF